MSIKTVVPEGLTTVSKDGSLKVTLIIPPALAAEAYAMLHPIQGRTMKLEMWKKSTSIKNWDDTIEATDG